MTSVRFWAAKALSTAASFAGSRWQVASSSRTIRADRKAKGVERARALTQVASVALRLIEAHSLQERLDAVEQVLRLRSA